MSETALPRVALDVVLPDGLRFVGERLERSQGIALAVRVPAGSKDDPSDRAGLAHLVTTTLYKGTRRRSARRLSDAFDFYGIGHSESTSTEGTTLQLRFLPEYLNEALGLLREVLSEPAFPPKEIATAKRLAIQELQHLEDEPLSKVFVELKKLYFGPQWGHSFLGEEGSIPGLKAAEVENFWRARYIPAGSIVAAAGNFDPDQMAQALERLFAHQGPAAPEAPAPRPPEQKVSRHVQRDTKQTQIALAFPAVPRHDPASYVMQLAVGVLAGGSSSRLFTEIREKRALVYSVGAQAVFLRGGGAIYAYAGTTAARAAETLEVLKGELQRLPHELSQDEIERARITYKAHMLMDQDSTAERARDLLDDVYYENRVIPLSESVRMIDAVTINDVRDYWLSHSVEPYALVTLGPRALE